MPTENDGRSKAKIAIVTGGSRGLGRNTVLSLAKRGVDSIFTYNSNQAEAARVVDLVAFETPLQPPHLDKRQVPHELERRPARRQATGAKFVLAQVLDLRDHCRAEEIEIGDEHLRARGNRHHGAWELGHP